MNHKNIKKNDDSEVIKLTNRSLELLKEGDLKEAHNTFYELLRIHFNYDIAEAGLKTCKYWIIRLEKINTFKEDIEKGKFLLTEWEKFELFIDKRSKFNKRVLSGIMYFVHNKALNYLKKSLTNRIIDAELIYLTGIANKRIGDYNSAIYSFEKALSIDINNANILAQLADSYALVDEESKAKLLFREAFFIEPDIIDIELLDSNIIHTIISKLCEMNIPRNEIRYWVPVYGRIFEVFNVYRELIPVEYGKLKQDIFSLEKEIETEGFYNAIKKARLINYYLWLYDYFLIKGNSKDEILYIENSIKKLSNDIYNLLKNKQEIK